MATVDDARGAPGRAARRPGRARPLVARVAVHILLAAVGIVFLLPFYWMVISSIRPQSQFYQVPIPLIAAPPSIENYVHLFARSLFARGLLNSLLLSAVAVVLQVFCSGLAGYTFAKLRFRGREALFVGVLATLMIPASVQLVPNFIVMARIHWVDTYWPLILPGIANAVGIFWVRQYCQSIPDELLDAARIDGAGELSIFWRIVVPVIQPAIVSLSIFVFLATWNDFLAPLVFLRSQDLFTAQIWLTIVGQTAHVPQPGIVMAGSVLASIPIIVLFATLQRRFVAGMTAGSVK